MSSTIRRRLEARDEGFTLIELLVVVIIIGILASVAIPVFLNQRNRAFRAAVQSDLRNIALEAETHFTDAQTYVGFLATAGWTGRRTSQGVTLTANPAHFTPTGFCFTGRHASLPAAETWLIRAGRPVAQTGRTYPDGVAVGATCP